MDQSEDGNLVCNQILLAITQLELAFTTIALAHSLGRFGAIRRFNLPAVQDLLKIAGMEKGLEAVFSLTCCYGNTNVVIGKPLPELTKVI